MHVIGLGSIGYLVAHHLRLKAGLPVTLLLRNTAKNAAKNAAIEADSYRICVQRGDDPETSVGYTVELLDKQADSPIQTLVVCTKAYDALAAVSSVSKRLCSSSTVVLLNNGLGVKEGLESCWQAGAKPTVVEAVVSHGVFGVSATSSQATVRHAGLGEFILSHPEWVDCFASLGARYEPSVAFQTAQLTKFVINCCVNPITALHGIYNGEARQHHETMQAILKECLAVLKKAFPAVQLGQAQVEETLDRVLSMTALNMSSMLQDVQAGRPLELPFLNGHLLSLAAQHGMLDAVPVNARLCQQLSQSQFGKFGGGNEKL